jgi:hypothetical protein
MRRRPRRPTFLLCAAILTAGLQLLRAQGQATPDAKTSKPSQTSTGQSKEQSNPSKSDALRQLEDDLFRSFKTPSPKGPLNPETELPRSAPATPSKRARKLTDQDKDWVFMKPEELMAVPTVEELLNLPPLEKDGRTKEKLSPFESYLDRLYHPEDPNRKDESSREPNSLQWNRNIDKAKEPASFGEGSEQDETDLPDSVRETQRNLRKKLSEPEPGFGTVSPPKSHSFFSDIFGLDVKAKELPSPQEIEAQKQRMEQLKALYGFEAAPSSIMDPSNPLMGLVQFGSTPAKMPTVTSPSLPNNPLAPPAVMGVQPLPDPNELPGVAKLLVPQSGFGSALPKTDQPKLAPPTPNFNAPRRPF